MPVRHSPVGSPIQECTLCRGADALRKKGHSSEPSLLSRHTQPKSTPPLHQSPVAGSHERPCYLSDSIATAIQSSVYNLTRKPLVPRLTPSLVPFFPALFAGNSTAKSLVNSLGSWSVHCVRPLTQPQVTPPIENWRCFWQFNLTRPCSDQPLKVSIHTLPMAWHVQLLSEYRLRLLLLLH